MNKKKINNTKKLILIILFAFSLIYSCSDNIINSDKIEFVGPRLKWDIDTLAIGTNEIVILDSNTFFTYSNYNQQGIIDFYKNNNKISYYSNMMIYSINGNNENNLFLGGKIEIDNGKSIPILKKFNNGSFQQINLKCDTAKDNHVTCIKIINNDVWCSTSHGEVIKYNNQNIDYYKIDTSYYSKLLSQDNFNNIYALMIKEIRDSNNIFVSVNFRFYNFKNGIWTKVFEESNPYLFSVYDAITGHIFVLKIDDNLNKDTYDFSNGKLNLIVNHSKFNINCERIGGNSLSNMILYGKLLSENNSRNLIHHYNGINISNEDFGYFLADSFTPFEIKYFFNTYYILVTETFSNSSFLLKGKFK